MKSMCWPSAPLPGEAPKASLGPSVTQGEITSDMLRRYARLCDRGFRDMRQIARLLRHAATCLDKCDI
jgi:hypothetical protein